MNRMEAIQAWLTDAPQLAHLGIIAPDVRSYLPDGYAMDHTLAMDAQPALVTTPNAGIPNWLTTMIDPTVFEILLSPVKAADIFGEQRKGSWTDQTALFPTLERTGEVSSYGDYADNGSTGVNTMWPQRQSYLFQTIKEYGELELERAGLARISWVSELDQAASMVMMRYLNLTYFFGVGGLENYGLLNDPQLTAPLTPGTKAAGGVTWIKNGAINCTANECYADIQALYLQLVTQTSGLIQADDEMTLSMSPGSEVALTATNTYNVNVHDLLKKNFPGMKVKTATQYGVTSATNPNGIAGGNLVQLMAGTIEGQQTGYCSFNEKARMHPIIRAMSSFKQKMTAGTWGSIIRQPFAISQMLGV